MDTDRTTRRTFIKSSAAIAGGAVLGAPLRDATARDRVARSAVDRVPLGRTGVDLCRLGFGTGSKGGSIQRALGQDEFTRLVRGAYDRGITYFDTADAYGTHEMLGRAIRHLPREELFIQTKMRWGDRHKHDKPLQVLDRFRTELGIDSIDSLLVHCVRTNDWDESLRPMLDALAEAQRRGIIRLKGVSCHGLLPLVRSTAVDWVDVHLVRINPQGRYVDSVTGRWGDPGDVPEVMRQIRAMHAVGRGVIGMKLVGNGDFTRPEDRQKAIQFAIECDAIDAVVIGFANMDEVDEAIVRINQALEQTT